MFLLNSFQQCFLENSNRDIEITSNRYVCHSLCSPFIHSLLAGMLHYVNSICKPRETLVQVEHEFPEVMHTGVVPSCVSVQRCGGCCLDEAMVCVSVAKHTTMMQVRTETYCIWNLIDSVHHHISVPPLLFPPTKLQLKQYAKNVHGEMIIELPFVEHSECHCRYSNAQVYDFTSQAIIAVLLNLNFHRTSLKSYIANIYSLKH